MGYSMAATYSIGDPLQRNTFTGYSKHFWESKIPKDYWNEITWVNRWYNPNNDRSIAPVQSRKFLEQPLPNLNRLPRSWVPHPELSIRSISRAGEENKRITFAHSARSTEWSTLRQMLPFKGHYNAVRPPKWGTNSSTPPYISNHKPKRYGHTNSPMTNYVDEMHQTNKLFRLH